MENFTDPPLYGTNYNPPFYKDLLSATDSGVLQTAVLQTKCVGRVSPFHRKYRQLMNEARLPGHRRTGPSTEQIAEDFRTVLNAAWVDHDNFKPMDQATALKIVKSMKPVMDPRLVVFVYHDDRAIAMYISLPELNEIFRYVNGDLNWWGKLKFLWHKRTGTVKNMTGIVFGVARNTKARASRAC